MLKKYERSTVWKLTVQDKTLNTRSSATANTATMITINALAKDLKLTVLSEREVTGLLRVPPKTTKFGLHFHSFSHNILGSQLNWESTERRVNWALHNLNKGAYNARVRKAFVISEVLKLLVGSSQNLNHAFTASRKTSLSFLSLKTKFSRYTRYLFLLSALDAPNAISKHYPKTTKCATFCLTDSYKLRRAETNLALPSKATTLYVGRHGNFFYFSDFEFQLFCFGDLARKTYNHRTSRRADAQTSQSALLTKARILTCMRDIIIHNEKTTKQNIIKFAHKINATRKWCQNRPLKELTTMEVTIYDELIFL